MIAVTLPQPPREELRRDGEDRADGRLGPVAGRPGERLDLAFGDRGHREASERGEDVEVELRLGVLDRRWCFLAAAPLEAPEVVDVLGAGVADGLAAVRGDLDPFLAHTGAERLGLCDRVGLGSRVELDGTDAAVEAADLLERDGAVGAGAFVQARDAAPA